VNEEQKAAIELEIFERFLMKAEIQVEHGSIKKELPPCPDLSCKIAGKGKAWFELTEACAPEFKQVVNELTKAIREAEELNQPMPMPPAVWGRDDSEQTVRKKIGKRYPISESVELLIYTDGMTVVTDEVLKARFEPILVNGAGQFSRVWLMGDDVHQIWPVIS